jgi:hypothetical protein
VEIGVARGELSHALLKHIPNITEYHAVDPFVGGYDSHDQMSELLLNTNGSIPWGQVCVCVCVVGGRCSRCSSVGV